MNRRGDRIGAHGSAGVDPPEPALGASPVACVPSHGPQRRTMVVDQLMLGMDAEPARRMARHRSHPTQPIATKPPSRYRLIPIARLKVMSPEPCPLVAEASVHGVEARELGYARDPAAVAAVLAPYFAAVQA